LGEARKFDVLSGFFEKNLPAAVIGASGRIKPKEPLINKVYNQDIIL
jgi:hypothetical protein